jgi:hypothetical protein
MGGILHMLNSVVVSSSLIFHAAQGIAMGFHYRARMGANEWFKLFLGYPHGQSSMRLA